MYQLGRLKNFPNLIHGFSERQDGNMSFHWGSKEEVVKNRKDFLKTLGIKVSDCVMMEISHQTEVVLVDTKFRDRGMDEIGNDLDESDNGVRADALVTSSRNAFLFLLTGDCLPVIFYDEKKKFVALVHLSRINTQKLFVQKIVGELEKRGSRPEDILVGFGPGILKDSYIFSEDEIKTRISDKEKWRNFLIRLPDGRIAVDFLGWNIRQLQDVGIPEKNIETSGIDTGSNKKFFSHYRSRKTGEKEGRMATVVGMKN